MPRGDVNLDIQYFGKWSNFIMGDAHHLPFRDRAFEKVYCSHTLEHLDNPFKFFEEATRALGDRGVLECNYHTDSMLKKRTIYDLLNLRTSAFKWKKRIIGDDDNPCSLGGHKWQITDHGVLTLLRKARFAEVTFYGTYRPFFHEIIHKRLAKINKYLPRWKLDTGFIAKVRSSE